jgi:mannosyltransferase
MPVASNAVSPMQSEPKPSAPPDPGRPRGSAVSGREVAFFAGLLLVALALRLYRLDSQSLWIDEVYQEYVAARPVRDIVRQYSLRADGGPLSLLISHFFVSSMVPEWTARLPSAIFGVLAVIATALVGRTILPGPIPWLGAALLAVSPLHIWYSQEARWYAQWVCFTALSYLAFVHAVRRGGLRRWLVYVVLAALDLYTFVLSFVVLASQALSGSQLSRPPGTGRLPRWMTAQIGVVVGAAPLVDMILRHRNAVTGSPRGHTLAAIPYTIFAYCTGFSLGPTLGELHAVPSVRWIVTEHPIVAIVFAVFVPLLLVGIVRVARDREAAAVLLPWLIGPPLLVFLLALASGLTYEVRYTLAALPAFTLVLAAGVCALPRAALRLGAGGAVAACLLAALANHYWNPRYAKEDVRTAVAAAIAADPAAPIVTIGQARAAVWFYARGSPIGTLAGCEPGVPDPDPVRAAELADAPALWVVVSRDWDGRAESCRARLLATHVSVEQRRYPGVELWRFEKRGAISRELG